MRSVEGRPGRKLCLSMEGCARRKERERCAQSRCSLGGARVKTSHPRGASLLKRRQRQPHRCEQKLRRHGTVQSLFVKAFESGLHGLRRAAFQEASRRGPEEQHVPHASRPGEHHIQVEPPLCIVQAQVSRRLQALALAGLANVCSFLFECDSGRNACQILKPVEEDFPKSR